ncbi:hypothetical protein KAT36_03805 [Candidatus Pacearchaeota archaeon]|nr:hypothetical protein [Candidatus Pacearchaeota archaeon]
METEKEFLFEGQWERFYVKEHGRCIEVIDAMMERVMLWDNFPTVDVILKNGLYYVIDEGHHTSLAHYFLNAPLKCSLKKETSLTFCKPEKYFPIGATKLVNIEDTVVHSGHLRMCDALSYFPRDSANRFCLKHNLDSTYFLSQ